MQSDIDFSPLANYSKAFLVIRLIRRARMVLTRVIWAALFIGALIGIFMAYNWANAQLDKPPAEEGYSTDYYYSFGNGETYNLSLLFIVFMLAVFGPTILTYLLMSLAWNKFAKVNGFSQLASQDVVRIPSFKGKLLSLSLGPVEGSDSTKRFTLHTRQYKEGGVLRWRERQMDTIVTLIVPASLPHIVINARANERARRSNMTSKLPSENKFQFEGLMGAKYDAYTNPESRVMALQLFTPDVLQVVYDKLPTADIEVKDNKIWIVQRYGVLDDSLAAQMFGAADDLYAQLERQARTAGLLAKNQ